MSNALNLTEINQEEAFNLASFNIRIGQNMLMLGQKGVGKTSIFKQAVEECGYQLSYVNLSTVERPDIGGYPILNDDSETIHFKFPFFLPPLPKNKKSNLVILFDEVDKCPEEITGPLLEILQYKTINGKPLNAVSCLLTGNLMEERAHSHQISSALLDRCSKYILTFDFYKWLDWARLNNVHELILGFLQSHPEFACGDIETTLLASPSPRGWSLASQAILQAREHKITDVETITNIVSGFVGSAAAYAFSAWYSYSREHEKHIPNIIEYGTHNIDYRAMDTTQQLVFCISLCHLGKSKILKAVGKKKIRYLENICRFFNDQRVAKEIQFMAISNAFPGDIIIKHDLYKSVIFFNLVSELQEGVKIK